MDEYIPSEKVANALATSYWRYSDLYDSVNKNLRLLKALRLAHDYFSAEKLSKSELEEECRKLKNSGRGKIALIYARNDKSVR